MTPSLVRIDMHRTENFLKAACKADGESDVDNEAVAVGAFHKEGTTSAFASSGSNSSPRQQRGLQLP